MNFNLNESIEVLQSTPATLENLLSGLSKSWLRCNEGENTWNAFEVMEHLIEAEKQNWIPRLEFILQQGESGPFPPFDRFSHLKKDSNKTIVQLITEFKDMRQKNIKKLVDLITTEKELEKSGSHPAFGVVKARELISTWVVHDLTHISQIVRVMANRYKDDVGPWIEYLGILKSRQ